MKSVSHLARLRFRRVASAIALLGLLLPGCDRGTGRSQATLTVSCMKLSPTSDKAVMRVTPVDVRGVDEDDGKLCHAARHIYTETHTDKELHFYIRFIAIADIKREGQRCLGKTWADVSKAVPTTILTAMRNEPSCVWTKGPLSPILHTPSHSITGDIFPEHQAFAFADGTDGVKVRDYFSMYFGPRLVGYLLGPGLETTLVCASEGRSPTAEVIRDCLRLKNDRRQFGWYTGAE